MQVRKNVLTLSIVAALGLSGAAMAQDQTPTGQKATDLDAVVVTGIRGAQEKSLDVKRDANSHVEVVTAEDVGKLPAHNVADTLQRLPGVNISSASADEGGFDEADRVSLRGTSPSLTQTLIDGHPVGSADWFVLSQGNTVGRSVSYTLLPSELVGSVEVNKTSQAKLMDGGAVGTVNIRTRKPLEFAKPITAEASVGMVRSDQAVANDPQLSGLFNYKNDQGTFGVMVQAFSQKRHLRREAQEVPGGFFQISPTSAAARSDWSFSITVAIAPIACCMFSMPCTVENCASWPRNSAPFNGFSGSWFFICSVIRRRKSACPMLPVDFLEASSSAYREYTLSDALPVEATVLMISGPC